MDWKAIKLYISLRLADFGSFLVLFFGVLIACALFFGVAYALSAIKKKMGKKRGAKR